MRKLQSEKWRFGVFFFFSICPSVGLLWCVCVCVCGCVPGCVFGRGVCVLSAQSGREDLEGERERERSRGLLKGNLLKKHSLKVNSQLRNQFEVLKIASVGN